MAEPLWLVLATPDLAKCTGRVYEWFDQLPDVHPRPDTGAMEAALAGATSAAVGRALCNVFEQVMLPRHPEIARLKAAMLAAGALGAVMSGAGPTVLGLVPDRESGSRLLAQVRPLAREAWLVRTVGRGPQAHRNRRGWMAAALRPLRWRDGCGPPAPEGAAICGAPAQEGLACAVHRQEFGSHTERADCLFPS